MVDEGVTGFEVCGAGGAVNEDEGRRGGVPTDAVFTRAAAGFAAVWGDVTGRPAGSR